MTDEKETSNRAGVRFFEAGTLYDIATEAAKKIKAEDPRMGEQLAALTSIVFCVISLEAFLNEMTESAEDNQHHDYEPQAVRLFAQMMRDMESASLENKLVMSSWVLAGKNLDRGAQPFQDLKSLISLRNQLVHFKPSALIVPHPEGGFVISEETDKKYLKKLEPKNILAPAEYQGGWKYRATTKAVAEWSCNTVAAVINDFAGKAPNGMWGTTVKGFAKRFKLE